MIYLLTTGVIMSVGENTNRGLGNFSFGAFNPLIIGLANIYETRISLLNNVLVLLFRPCWCCHQQVKQSTNFSNIRNGNNRRLCSIFYSHYL
jgi:hypothetical protein